MFPYPKKDNDDFFKYTSFKNYTFEYTQILNIFQSSTDKMKKENYHDTSVIVLSKRRWDCIDLLFYTRRPVPLYKKDNH